MPPTHESLDRIDGSGGVGDRLTFGGFSNEDLALVIEGNNAGSQAVPFKIGDDFRLIAFHYRDDRVSGAQIDTDYFFALCHFSVLPLLEPICPISKAVPQRAANTVP